MEEDSEEAEREAILEDLLLRIKGARFTLVEDFKRLSPWDQIKYTKEVPHYALCHLYNMLTSTSTISSYWIVGPQESGIEPQFPTL